MLAGSDVNVCMVEHCKDPPTAHCMERKTILSEAQVTNFLVNPGTDSVGNAHASQSEDPKH